MYSSLTLRWLERLKHQRSIDSLISEVYGEAAMYGSLFEREVADLLNYYDLATLGVASLLREPYNTDDSTLNSLLKELKKRGVPEDLFQVLDDGRDARNELVHRLIATELVVSRIEKEMLIERIAGLYFRIWRAFKAAANLKVQFAAKIGVTEERIAQQVQKLKKDAEIEDSNIRRILGDVPDADGS